MDEDYAAMMADHDKLEGGVYLVEVFERERFVQHGIFSNSAVAREWMKSLPNEFTCMSAPFVLDNPDYGNVRKEDMQ